MFHLILDVQRHSGLVACPSNHDLKSRRFSTREENVALLGERPPGNSFIVFELVPSRERNDQRL
jgi:hypothetical protein